jgi:hypothetical protein
MDMQMQGEGGTPPTWDVFVVPGVGANIVPMISGPLENTQEASVACGMQLGMCPQNPAAGCDYLGFLTGTVAFGTLDAQLRAFLASVGRSDFYPNYAIASHGLQVIPTSVPPTVVVNPG